MNMNNPWNIELKNMPGFDQALERVNAWLNFEMIDRPPIRFTRTNAEYETGEYGGRTWPTEEARWMDAEFWVDSHIKSIEGKTFRAETFPCFWPNLGPFVFAACYGMKCIWADVTSWAEPMIFSYDDIPVFDMDHAYIHKLEEMTRLAIEKSDGRYLVGYTDIIPGIDCLAGMRGTQPLMFDLIDHPNEVLSFMDIFTKDFIRFYDHFYTILKEANQPIINWLNVPMPGKLHTPVCDAAFMISTGDFERFVIPTLYEECSYMDYNICHVDGRGHVRHVDAILELPNMKAIQWTQGVGLDAPMLQWVPFIKEVQSKGKGIVVDITLKELDDFIEALSPEGLYLCIETETEEEELAVIKRVEKW